MISILVVDEEEDYRKLLAEEMAAAGYQVTTAADPRHAMEVVLSSKPPLILLNPYISGREGFALLEEFGRSHSEASVVVMVPQHVPEDDWLSKARGYFLKGSDMAGVKQVVAEILACRRT